MKLGGMPVAVIGAAGRVDAGSDFDVEVEELLEKVCLGGESVGS